MLEGNIQQYGPLQNMQHCHCHSFYNTTLGKKDSWVVFNITSSMKYELWAIKHELSDITRKVKQNFYFASKWNTTLKYYVTPSPSAKPLISRLHISCRHTRFININVVIAYTIIHPSYSHIHSVSRVVNKIVIDGHFNFIWDWIFMRFMVGWRPKVDERRTH